MITAYVELGEVCRLSVDGHATGSPEVCAGVSAVVYALAGYLTNRVPEAEIRLDSGRAQISCRGQRAMFEMAWIGLAQIEKAHPEFIRVECGRELEAV